uniref:Uncharacterized protein n=1 Tax=Aegilops tauschii subsp. strangulata TaxID=200361 RepID=A0A453J6D1_AEGTS
MSVSSVLSSFLYGCFNPAGGRYHHHRAGAYYHSSHPTSADTMYYNQSGFAGGRRMGRSSRPLSLQVYILCSQPACMLCSSLEVLDGFVCLPSSVMDRHCIKEEKRDFLVCSDEYMQVQEPGFLCRYATATRPCMCPDYSL